MFVKGRGFCGNGEGDGAGEWGGELRYNVIKIGWLLQSSTCYCLLDLKRKNRHVFFFFNRILSTDLRSELGFEVVAPIYILRRDDAWHRFCTCVSAVNLSDL